MRISLTIDNGDEHTVTVTSTRPGSLESVDDFFYVRSVIQGALVASTFLPSQVEVFDE